MVEVFKTNVRSEDEANKIVTHIQKMFGGYRVTFDLEDCDRIMRIESTTTVQSFTLIGLLNNQGYVVEILPDDNLSLLRSIDSDSIQSV